MNIFNDFRSTRVGGLQRLDDAISKFQEFAGLEVTGRLDADTVDMMQKPRCGVKDFIDEDEDIDSPRIKVKGILSRKKVDIKIDKKCADYNQSCFNFRDMSFKDLAGESRILRIK